MNNVNDLLALLEKENIIEFFHRLTEFAIAEHATDIHIEPFEDYTRIRFRIDGDLLEIMKINIAYHRNILTRIKIMSKLDIAERRLPQDGRISFSEEGEEKINLRVSCIPTINGEKIELRILNLSNVLTNKTDLGIQGETFSILEKIIEKPTGMFLLCGPTGCGKTTTLYSILNQKNRDSINIITIEDPVEYKIEGINQIQVNDKIGLGFDVGLRSILRQDPNLIMVGEMRDSITAEIAIRSAITGHFVLSTLHTTDSFSAIIRLKDMGIEPYLISAALNGIASQRLVKKLCPKCKVKRPLDKKYVDFLQTYRSLKDDAYVYDPIGCEYCHQGYRGRTAIMEIFEYTEDYGELIKTNCDTTQLRSLGKKHGFKNMFENGLDLVFDGVTSIEELLKTVQIF